jgi:hypothetical protein
MQILDCNNNKLSKINCQRKKCPNFALPCVPAVFSFQYTINSKKVEVAVKKIISGEAVEQKGALANPKSLNLYYNIPQLETPSSSSMKNGT